MAATFCGNATVLPAPCHGRVGEVPLKSAASRSAPLFATGLDCDELVDPPRVVTQTPRHGVTPTLMRFLSAKCPKIRTSAESSGWEFPKISQLPLTDWRRFLAET